MDKDETLIRERLARLHGHSGKSSSRNDTALQGRLDALSGRSSCAEGASENFNNRLASLLLPAEGGNASPTTVEDLSTRLSRLTSGNSGDGVASASPVKQPPHRAYGVPEVSRPGALVPCLQSYLYCDVYTVLNGVDITTIFHKSRSTRAAVAQFNS